MLGVPEKMTFDDDPEQMVAVPEILAVGLGNRVTTNWSLTAAHVPAGSFVVIVKVTVPAAISAAIKSYVPAALVPLLVNLCFAAPLDEVHSTSFFPLIAPPTVAL